MPPQMLPPALLGRAGGRELNSYGENLSSFQNRSDKYSIDLLVARLN
jgi:hypothetical protein